jgi:hypothetical protein
MPAMMAMMAIVTTPVSLPLPAVLDWLHLRLVLFPLEIRGSVQFIKNSVATGNDTCHCAVRSSYACKGHGSCNAEHSG